MSFNIGDIIRGKGHNYGITNENMYEGIVTNVYSNGNIDVKVQKHKEDDHIGNEFEVDPKHFELVRSKDNKLDQLLEILGLELNEEFEIEGDYYNPYKITESGLIDRDGDNYNEFIWDLVTGKSEIKKLSWTPKEGKLFFFYEMNGLICEGTYSTNSVYHKSLTKLGNYARTADELKEKEAEIKGKLEIDKWVSY